MLSDFAKISLLLGWAEFPFVRFSHVRRCNRSKGTEISCSGNFTFFWRVSFPCINLSFIFMLGKWISNMDSDFFFRFYWREKLNSMNLLLYMAPIAVVLLLPATLFMEENVVGITLALAREDIKIIWLLLFNSALAYFVNLTNFLVTKHTSALTLQVFLLPVPCYLFSDLCPCHIFLVINSFLLFSLWWKLANFFLLLSYVRGR